MKFDIYIIFIFILTIIIFFIITLYFLKKNKHIDFFEDVNPDIKIASIAAIIVTLDQRLQLVESYIRKAGITNGLLCIDNICITKDQYITMQKGAILAGPHI